MNNIVLIRGDKIAFSMYPGSFGDDSYCGFDLTELITPFGLFIPVVDHGLQAIPMLNPSRMFNAADVDELTIAPGEKGILIADIPSGVQFNKVKIVAKKLGSIPLFTGKKGFAIISPYDHLEAMMAMCVRLTDTIEAAVDMYCKYAKCRREHVLIWDKQQCKQFIKDNWTEELDKSLDSSLGKK